MNEQPQPTDADGSTARELHLLATAAVLPIPPSLPDLRAITFDFWQDLLNGDLVPRNVGGGIGWSRK